MIYPKLYKLTQIKNSEAFTVDIYSTKNSQLQKLTKEREKVKFQHINNSKYMYSFKSIIKSSNLNKNQI